MSSHKSIGKAVPTFLQPNTAITTRDKIFNDGHSKQKKLHQKSKRGGDDSDSSDDDDDESEARTLILEKLYGQMSGSIQIEDRYNSSTSTTYNSADKVSQDVDMEEEEEEDDAMEFRLFSTQDTSAKITINAKEPELVYVHRERAELDESPNSIRMQQIKVAAIDAALVLSQSKVPWERSFFPHRVKVITLKEQQENPKLKKVKKSKRKREWEKKLKAGLIEKSTIIATARKIKVSESWGQEPYLVPKGLGKNTIVVGGASGSRDSRRGRGGKNMRGSTRGAMRGSMRGGRGNFGGDRGSRPSPVDKKGSDRGVNPRKDDSQDQQTLSSSAKPVVESSKKSESPAQIPSSKPLSTSTKDESKAVLPSKKPKVKPQSSKLDNIMAILTGK